MSFQERDRARALSSLAKFATNFNQEQVHVRGVKKPRTGVPYQYEDGSYNTEVVRWNGELEYPIIGWKSNDQSAVVVSLTLPV